MNSYNYKPLAQNSKAASQISLGSNNNINFAGQVLPGSPAFTRYIPINHSINSHNYNLNVPINYSHAKNRFSMYSQDSINKSTRSPAGFNTNNVLNRKNSMGRKTDVERWRTTNSESPLIYPVVPKSPHPDPRRMSRSYPITIRNEMSYRSASSGSSESLLSESELKILEYKRHQSVHSFNNLETKPKLPELVNITRKFEKDEYNNNLYSYRNNYKILETEPSLQSDDKSLNVQFRNTKYMDLEGGNSADSSKRHSQVFKYAKFSPYRRIELSSSSGSLNKSNVLHLAGNKNSPHLYDSGIGVDAMLSKNEDQQPRKVYSETLNPTLARKLYDSSKFSPVSSLSGSTKSRKKLEDLFQLNKSKENTVKRVEMNSDDLSKSSLLSLVSIPVRNLSDEKKVIEFHENPKRASQIYVSRSMQTRRNSIRRGEAKMESPFADFTPQLLKDSVRQKLLQSSKAAMKENEIPYLKTKTNFETDNQMIDQVIKKSVNNFFENSMRESNIKTARPRSLGIESETNFPSLPLLIERRIVKGNFFFHINDKYKNRSILCEYHIYWA